MLFRKKKNNVYLIPHEDATYEACISPIAPSQNAVFLTGEGKYPVNCYYSRLDANGSAVYEMYRCSHRNELVDSLNYSGQAFHTIRFLWEFDSHRAVRHEAWAIFNAATNEAYSERRKDKL